MLELWDFLQILNEHMGFVGYEYYCYVYLKILMLLAGISFFCVFCFKFGEFDV